MSSKIAVAIVQDGRQFLMAKRRLKEADLTWTFPGGAVHAGESDMSAAEREVKEEVGVTCRGERILGSRTHPSTGKEIAYVLCGFVQGEAHVIDCDELAEVKWMTVPEILQSVTSNIFGPVKEYLQKVDAADS